MSIASINVKPFNPTASSREQSMDRAFSSDRVKPNSEDDVVGFTPTTMRWFHAIWLNTILGFRLVRFSEEDHTAITGSTGEYTEFSRTYQQDLTRNAYIVRSYGNAFPFPISTLAFEIVHLVLFSIIASKIVPPSNLFVIRNNVFPSLPPNVQAVACPSTLT
jgi:hypothetical protein